MERYICKACPVGCELESKNKYHPSFCVYYGDLTKPEWVLKLKEEPTEGKP